MTVNQYLIANPDAIEGVFTRLFAKYFMRYYDEARDYSLSFDYHTPSSYNDSRNKVIVIAMENVQLLLKHDVPVLAIAYHELAHTLYTSQTLKEKIVKQIFYDHPQNNIPEERFYETWNVLEDERIERKMVKDYKFLNEIVTPLRTVIEGDGLLMTWRNGLRKEKAPQELIELAEEFASKKLTAQRASEIVYQIQSKYYPYNSINVQLTPPKQSQSSKQSGSQSQNNGEMLQPSSKKESEESGEEMGASENDERDENDDEQENEGDGAGDEADDENETQKGGNAEGDDELDGDNPLDNLTEEENEEWKTYQKSLGTAREAMKKMKEIETLEGQNEIKSLLKNYQSDIIEQSKREVWNQTVKDTGEPLRDIYSKSLSKNYNFKASVKNGMSQAKAKHFSSDVSNRLSVQKIIETTATNQEPKIFYNKGKDIAFMKKIVVFEDISGSTGNIEELFSTIAFSLVNAFETSEWWAYANYLYKKHKVDYPFVTAQFGKQKKLGGGTKTQNLLTVMEHYQNDDNIYVLITDGDMHQFFEEEHVALFNKFKDKIAIIGLLDDEIKQNVKYHYDIRETLTRMNKTEYNLYDYNQDTYMQLRERVIVEGVSKVIEIIQNRIR